MKEQVRARLGRDKSKTFVRLFLDRTLRHFSPCPKKKEFVMLSAGGRSPRFVLILSVRQSWGYRCGDVCDPRDAPLGLLLTFGAGHWTATACPSRLDRQRVRPNRGFSGHISSPSFRRADKIASDRTTLLEIPLREVQLGEIQLGEIQLGEIQK
jgi:hypothetical protein